MVGTSYILFVLSLAILESTAAKPDLYFFPASPPSRIALMTAHVLGTDVNIKPINIMKGEQFTPEFLKMNPQHTVPVLDDNGFVLAESRAIQAYLADSSPNGEKIYPKDVKKRAIIEQMLYFDNGRLFPTFGDLYRPMAMENKPWNEDRAKVFSETLGMLEEYLSRSEWAAGDQMSIADLSLLGTMSTVEAVGHDISNYPKITAWLSKSKAAVPNYEIACQEGINIWKKMAEGFKKP